MARYIKNKIFEQAKKLANEKKLLFVQDIIDFLPLSKPTFYNYFPVGSNEFNELNKILDENKVAIKTSLRAKWYQSDNATLQMALYKLTSNAEEHKKLQQNYIDHTSKDDKIDSNKIEIVFTSNTNED